MNCTSDDSERQAALEIRLLTIMMMKLHARHQEQRLAEQRIDLSVLQMGILRVLRRHEWTLSELSRHMVYDPSTLVPAVDKLERSGYLERQRDPRDRRRLPLAITPEGRELVERIPFMSDDDPLLTGIRALGQEQAGQLAVLLRRLLTHQPEGEALLKDIEAHLLIHQTQPSDG